MNADRGKRAQPAAAATGRVVLTINSGSATLKWGLHRVQAGACTSLRAQTQDRSEARAAVRGIAQALREAGLPAPEVIGHRIVHGGPGLTRHCLIDAAVLAGLRSACVFAPLHGPAALELIEATRQQFAGTLEVACLDTAFHADLPEEARWLPIPRHWQAAGLRRYGFHGLSCESILRQLGNPLPQRLVIAHLGGGASVSAVLAGRSIDTSMGLTPSGGLVMGSRSGDLDPGVPLHLLQAQGLDAAALEGLLNRESGMLGLSGLSADPRALHPAAATDPAAALALRVFCRSAHKHIAAMASVLGGLDALVFTGGIGENDPRIRAGICAGLSHLGLALDARRNQDGADEIDAPGSPIRVRVLGSAEDAQIALHAATLCGPRA